MGRIVRAGPKWPGATWNRSCDCTKWLPVGVSLLVDQELDLLNLAGSSGCWWKRNRGPTFRLFRLCRLIRFTGWLSFMRIRTRLPAEAIHTMAVPIRNLISATVVQITLLISNSSADKNNYWHNWNMRFSQSLINLLDRTVQTHFTDFLFAFIPINPPSVLGIPETPYIVFGGLDVKEVEGSSLFAHFHIYFFFFFLINEPILRMKAFSDKNVKTYLIQANWLNHGINRTIAFCLIILIHCSFFKSI